LDENSNVAVLMRRAALPALVFLVSSLSSAPSTMAQGMPLGSEFRVNTYTSGDQTRAAVAAEPSGNFMIVWSSYGQDGSGFGVFGQRYDDTGAPLGPEFRVNTFTTGSQFGPSVATDPLGNFVVVWSSYDQVVAGSMFDVFGQRYASTGAPVGPEFRVSTFTGLNQSHPAVAVDGSGSFVVVWESEFQDGSDLGIFGQRFASSGSPLGTEFRVNGFTNGLQARPDVASDPAGNFVVAWHGIHPLDGSGYGVIAQRYASTGAPLGAEFRVNTFTLNSQYRPAVAADASGSFVIVWDGDTDGSSYGVFGQRYSGSGAPVGAEFRVNSYTTSFQGYAAVAPDPAGNFVVTWFSQDQDGSANGVFGQRHAANGPPLGPEFRVNTYTTSFQQQPAVAADASGNFVVTWFSQNQDGSLNGVYAQRYGPIFPIELLDFSVE
jgi:hypothetical protein